MRKSIYTYAMALVLPILALMTSCEPRGLKEDDVFTTTDQDELALIIKTECAKFNHGDSSYTIYTLDGFLDQFLTKQGNYWSDTSQYRTRSHNENFPDVWLFTVDTIPSKGAGIYIRGRVSTDDYAGNFYKSMVIQQIVNGEQQNLRISVDMSSVAGMYQLGQEILIRCNGLAVGCYANQPQLCVPSYNNNINAKNADQKVGWAPGRIPGADFRKATKLLGVPDPNALQYKEVTIEQLYTIIDQSPAVDSASFMKVRKQDGMLVRLKNVHFSGQYNKYGDLLDCVAGNPDPGDGEAHDDINVFAPSTGNVGYPQSRVLTDASGKVILCSSSEYAKYAHYYLPGADKTGVSNCSRYEGTVSGILGWYADDASRLPADPTDLNDDNAKSYQYDWSVTPRGIPGYGVNDIKLQYEVQPEEYEWWVPVEFDPNAQ